MTVTYQQRKNYLNLDAKALSQVRYLKGCENLSSKKPSGLPDGIFLLQTDNYSMTKGHQNIR